MGEPAQIRFEAGDGSGAQIVESTDCLLRRAIIPAVAAIARPRT